MNKILKLQDITRELYCKYNWVEVTEMGSSSREFVEGGIRTPEEAHKAGIYYDAYMLYVIQTPSWNELFQSRI